MVVSSKPKRPLVVSQSAPDLVSQKCHIIAIYYALAESGVSQDSAGLNTESQHFSQIKERISLEGKERGINVIHAGQTNK